MVKPINEYTIEELSAKIEAIKAERERTANALKRYEEELEHRKKELPSGVPLKGMPDEMPHKVVSRGLIEFFLSEVSADKFEDYHEDFVKALQDIADGKPIDIKALCPLLPKGYVVMTQEKHWLWFENKPYISVMDLWSSCIEKDGHKEYIRGELIRPFNIKPVKDWRNSMMECGL